MRAASRRAAEVENEYAMADQYINETGTNALREFSRPSFRTAQL